MTNDRQTNRDFFRTFFKGFHSSLLRDSGRKSSLLKAMAWAVVLIFTAQTLGAAAPALPAGSPKQDSAFLSLQIPEELGNIESKYPGSEENPKQAFVIHIQDAHGYPEAQKSISKILSYLAAEKTIGSIALEAAFQPLDPSLLKITDSEKTNLAIARRMTDAGELTGAEIFALSPESKGISFVGAEDKDLYFKSLEVFRQLKSRKSSWAPAFQSYQNTLDALEKQQFSHALRQFVQKRRSWEKGNDEAFDYLKLVIEQSKALLQKDFRDPQKQFEWPNLSRAAALNALESGFKQESAARELLDLQNIFKKQLASSKQKELILSGLEILNRADGRKSFGRWVADQTLYQEVRSTRHFFEIISRESRKAGIQLLLYPQFLSWAGSLILQSEIEPHGLLKELQAVEPELEQKLVGSRKEKNILDAGKDLMLLGKLLSLEMSRRDLERYAVRSKQLTPEIFQAKIKTLSGKDQSEMLPGEDLKAAESFYRFSRQRDEKLTEPVLKQIAAGKNTVLVTGGFHSEGIADILKKKNISYMSITPRMTSLHGESFYEKIMMGEAAEASEAKAAFLGPLDIEQIYPQDGRFTFFRDRQRNVLLSASRTELSAQGWKGPEIEKQLLKYQASQSAVFGAAKKAAAPQAKQGSPKTRRSESFLAAAAGVSGLGSLLMGLSSLNFRSENRAESFPLDVQKMNPEEELKMLERILQELINERNQGTGNLPIAETFSDVHGGLERLDPVIVDRILSVLPNFDKAEKEKIARAIVRSLRAIPILTLQEVFEPYGIDLKRDLEGKIFFENLGDLIDRGPDGIKTSLRSAELFDLGLSSFITGNHDLYGLMSLLGYHLPWYKNFEFYGYKDNYGSVSEAVAKFHAENPAEASSKSWWSVRLAEFVAYKKAEQKQKWDPLNHRVNDKGGLWDKVSRSKLTPEEERVWNFFRGFYLVQISTGTRAAGLMSVQWWKDLLDGKHAEANPKENFKGFRELYAELKTRSGFNPDDPSARAWEQAINMIEHEILAPLEKDFKDHVETQGEWWWRVFDAVNYKNYVSPEWYALDWATHGDKKKGWGPRNFQEANEINQFLNGKGEDVNLANFLDEISETKHLRDMRDFFMRSFNLSLKNIYQTSSLHSFLPVIKEGPYAGRFYFDYKGQSYVGNGDTGSPSIWEGLQRISEETRAIFSRMKESPETSEQAMGELHEAFRVVTGFYADVTTESKPKDIAWAINEFGPETFARLNGVRRLITAHVPILAFASLSREERLWVNGFLAANRFGFSDRSWAEPYGRWGGVIETTIKGSSDRFPESFYLLGYETADSETLVNSPRTIRLETGAEPDQPFPVILFENPGISKENFLTQVIVDVQERIKELKRSEMRVEDLSEVIREGAKEKLGIDLSKLTSAELSTIHSYERFFKELIWSSGRWLADGSAGENTRKDKILEVLHRPYILNSPDTFIPALISSGIFKPALKNEEGSQPDSSQNGASMESLSALSKATPHEFTAAVNSLYSAVEDIFRVDFGHAVVIHGIYALSNTGARGIPTLISFLAPSMDAEYIKNARFALRGMKQETKGFLSNTVLKAHNDRSRNYYAAAVDSIFVDPYGRKDDDPENKFDPIEQFVSSAPQREKLREVLGSYEPSATEWVRSKLFLPGYEKDRNAAIETQIKNIQAFRVKMTEAKFRRLLENWGIATVSFWAQQNFESQAEIFNFLAGLPDSKTLVFKAPEEDEPVVDSDKEYSLDTTAAILTPFTPTRTVDKSLSAAIKAAQAESRMDFLWKLLIVLTQGNVFNYSGALTLIDEISKNPAQSEDLISFLTVLFRLGDYDYQEGEFMQLQVSKLLHSPTEPVYYTLRNLAANIPHAISTGKSLEMEIRNPIMEADQAHNRAHTMIHYLRMKLHRDPSNQDHVLVNTVLKNLMLLHHPDPAKRIGIEDLPRLLGDVVRGDFQKGTFEHMLNPHSAVIAGFLFEELNRLKAPPDAGPEFFIKHPPRWEGYTEEEQQSLAFQDAKKLISTLQAAARRYVSGVLTPEMIHKAERLKTSGEIPQQIQKVNQDRSAAKKRLLTKSSMKAYPKEYRKRHQAAEEGFNLFGIYFDYKEEYFDLFEEDRKNKSFAELLHEKYLEGEFSEKKVDITQWVSEALHVKDRQEQNFPEKLRKDLAGMIDSMTALIEMMAIDGLATDELAAYAQTLREGEVNLDQVHTIFFGIQAEIDKIYDFFNTKYAGYPEIVANALGKDGINPMLRVGIDSRLSKEEWARVLQEKVMAELYIEEKSITLLKRYADGFQELFQWENSEKSAPDLRFWKDETLKPSSAAEPEIVTSDNYKESPSGRPIYVGFKALENFRMAEEGYPVPPLVVLPANLAQKKDLEIDSQNKALRFQVIQGLLHLEKKSGEVFPFEASNLTDEENAAVENFRRSYDFNPAAPPLLLSVRSGSFISMPGMLDTVLNMPLNSEIVKQMIDSAEGDEKKIKFVLDNYRRFLASYGIAHFQVKPREFAQLVDNVKQNISKRLNKNIRDIGMKDFTIKDMEQLVMLHVTRLRRGERMSDKDLDPLKQIVDVVVDIYKSWEKPDAEGYRKKFGIADSFGTSVTLQKMVFGNRNENSGTAVVFTSDPSTGRRYPSGAFKDGGQGADLVGGTVGFALAITREEGGEDSLEARNPELYNALTAFSNRIDRDYGPSDVEVTIEDNKIFLLQRRGMPLVGKGRQVWLKPEPQDLSKPKVQGVPVSPNAAVGPILDARNVSLDVLRSRVERLREELDKDGKSRMGIILILDYVDDNVAGMLVDIQHQLGLNSVTGIISSKSGRSNHAGLVARRLGIAYVSEVNIEFDDINNSIRIGGKEVLTGMRGPILSIDGRSHLQSETSGAVFLQEIPFYVNGESVDEEVPAEEIGPSKPYDYDVARQPVLTQEPARVALNLGAYRVDAQGQPTSILMSNFDLSPQVVANTVSNRVLEAYLRELLGDPNVSLSDIYGVENVDRFYAFLKGNIAHNRFPAELLEMKKEGEQYTLYINGHPVRIHQGVPSPETLQTSQTEYLIDFSDTGLTRETNAGRQARAEQLQQNSGIKKVIIFSPDDDPAENVLAAGINEDVMLKPENTVTPLASPVTSSIALVLKAMDTAFPGQFDFYAAPLASRPMTGDAGSINFLSKPFGNGLRGLFPQYTPKSAQAPVTMFEYAIEKGAGNVRLFLSPKKGSEFDLSKFKKEEKEAKEAKVKELKERLLKAFQTFADRTPHLRVAGSENLNSLLGIRDRHAVVIDSQALAENGILESGQVELYFHVNDYGYASLINQVVHNALVKDKPKADMEAQFRLKDAAAHGQWRPGTIPPNHQKKIERFVKEGDEIGFAVLGARGRIGKQLVQMLTEDPNYRPVAFIGVQDLTTMLAQYREDLVEGPIVVTQVGKDGIQKDFRFVKSPDMKEGISLFNEEFNEYILDPRADASLKKPLSIPYFYVAKREGETEETFERRAREEIGEDRIQTIETVFNATGAFLSSKDPYYKIFTNGNGNGSEDHSASSSRKLRRIMITAPPKSPEDVDITVVRGVNEKSLVQKVEERMSEVIFCSGASCTTTGLGRALVENIKFLESSDLKIKNIRFVTHHAQTPSQGQNFGGSSAGKSQRTATDPSMSAMLEATGANKVMVQIEALLKGMLSGNSHRDGNFGGSLLAVTAFVESKDGKYPTAEEINEQFLELSKLPEYKGILSYEPAIQSTAQIVGNEAASLFMPQFTRVEQGAEGATVTILLGYDNERGYTAAQVELDKLAAKALRGIETQPVSADLGAFRQSRAEVRSELRISPEIEKSFRALQSILGPERPYKETRWVTLHATRGISLPVSASQAAQMMPFLDADLFHPFGTEKAVKEKNKEAGLHVSAVRSLSADPEDLIYAGIAQVLNENPHRYVRLVTVEGKAEEIEAMNLAFRNLYPQVSSRFEIKLLNRQGKALEQGIQKVIDDAMHEAQAAGIETGSAKEFYQRVSVSSDDSELLGNMLVPVKWRILNDVVNTPALEAHLMRRGLDLSQNLLSADRIRKLEELSARIIASAELFEGEDLSVVADLFARAFGVRAIYTSA